MHVHRIAKMAHDALRALLARFLLVGIATFAVQHLLVTYGHAAAANPILAVAGVNMVEIGQRQSFG